MRSVYLILAATAAVVTCKPQRGNNDIIWYPVEREDGVFISIYGERHRTPPRGKGRSHRRTRFSGDEPFSYSPYPTQIQEPTFYHNGRRPQPFPQAAPSFQHQPDNPYSNNPYTNYNPYPNLNNPYPNNPFLNQGKNRPTRRPQSQNYDEAEFQEILNEVFELDKHFPEEFSKKGKQNQWGQNAQLIESASDSEWLNNPERPHIPIRPIPSNTDQSNRPGKPNRRPSKPDRTTVDPDALVFPDQTTPNRRRTTTTPSTLIPTERPTLSPCERVCPVTPEFNPVCGTDSVTYSNAGKLKCAQMCGKDVTLSHYGNCGRSRLVTPPLSDQPRTKKRGNRRWH